MIRIPPLRTIVMSFSVVLLAALWAPPASAWQTYSADPVSNTGNCANCHGDFNGGNYTSLKDGTPWPANLMNGHNRFIDGGFAVQCQTCHISPGDAPVNTNMSGGPTRVQGCVGCHGRDEDITPNDGAFGGPTPGRGDGLRAHHASAGVTTCAGCHAADAVQVGEEVQPFNYLASGGNVLALLNASCMDAQFGPDGLDNDGDGLTDGNDPDCAVNQAPVANAGPDQNANVGDTVTLDGSGSSDADGDALIYSWTLTTPAGSGAGLSDPTAVSPTFVPDVEGTYTATLIVNDGTVDSAPDSATITAQLVVVNTPPVANAGVDQTVTVGDTVTLDGSGSTDADGDPLTYSWMLAAPAGSTAVLSDATAVAPTFVADVEGMYTATLIVNDGMDDSAPDSATITAQIVVVNTPPVANAGADQTVNVGDTVTLDGSGSTDADGDPLTYSWTLTTPAGSGAVLSDATAVAPTFVADAEGTYTAELIVNDGMDSSTPDSATITAQLVVVNTPPVANAGADQTVNVGDTVTLDGSGSTDADGDPLTYIWTLTTVPAGSGATLTGNATVNPTFVADVAGDYVAQLIVNDGMDDSAPDTVMITASVVPPVNTPPVANAGLDQTVTVGDTVALDGSGSSDADGDPLTYIWTLTTVPAGSGATLVGANTMNPTFVADVAGDYVAQLIVNDGMDDSAPDTVMITASAVPPMGGEALYNANCVFCHGDPFMGPAVDPTLVGQRRVTGARECSIEASIYGNPRAEYDETPFPNGVAEMQFLRGLPEADILAISEYLNSQSFDFPGERRYVTACAGCHGNDASGGFVDEDVRGEDAGDTKEAIYDEDAMNFLMCLPTSDIYDMGNYLRSLDDDDEDEEEDDEEHDEHDDD